MAVDMFLQLDGIKGESKDDKFKESIDILAWSWGVSNSGSAHMGGGQGTGKANFQDISFTKYVDKSTPDIMYACSSGKHVPKATLTVRKAGDKPLDYMIIKLDDILVSSISTGGGKGEERLTENITLNFAKVSLEYWTQAASGAKDKNALFGWDIPANKKL
jgi:type VI secretion system secreted protein Hcp